jgi:hypothetical protein
MSKRNLSMGLLFVVWLLLSFQAACGGGKTIVSETQGSSSTPAPVEKTSSASVSLTPTVAPLVRESLNAPTLKPVSVTNELTIQAISPTPTATVTPVLSVTRLPVATLPETCPATEGYTWAFTYGDQNFNRVAGIIPTQDGGIVFVGNGGSFIPGAYVVWAAKFNPDGTVAWRKAYKGTTGDSTGVAEPVNAGRIVVVNGGRAFAISEQDGSLVWQMSTQDAGPASDTPDGGFALVREKGVVKFDARARRAWQVAFKNNYWVGSTAKGEFIFARAFLYADSGSIYRPIFSDIEVVKVNSEGKIAWQKTYGKSLGDDETLDAMLITQDGGVLLAGTHYGKGEFGETDIWVLKLSPGGGLSWQTTLSGKWWDDVYRLAQAPDGEFFLSGHTEKEIGEKEILVVKLRTNGSVAWQRTLSNYGDVGEVLGLKDGGVLVSLANDTLLVRLNRLGNLVWEKTYDWGNTLDILRSYHDDLLLGGTRSGSALLIDLHDSGAVSGVIQARESNLKISSSIGSRPNPKLEISQTDMLVKAPGISAVDLDLMPVPLCLSEGGQEVVPTYTPTSTPVITPSPTPPAFTRSLFLTSPRMSGDEILAVQIRLIALGYSEVGTPDGVFGEMTDQAVRHFQKRNGLEVDGIVGPKTWERLFSAGAVRSD